MFRRLQAIEIAEGALLADIAVIFQWLSIYLPVGGHLLHTLVFTVFAVLVLRRGLYTAIMGLCVAAFVIAIATGPQHIITMAIEGMGGLFLGVCMKYRLRHTLILFLGVTFGALTIYLLTFFLLFALGISLDDFVRSLHHIYGTLLTIINTIATRAGLALFWRQRLYPLVAALASWGFTYLWIAYYLALWVGMIPGVAFFYAFTNFLVRLLGYDVRPFPDGKIGKLLVKARKRIIRIGIKRGLIKRQSAHA